MDRSPIAVNYAAALIELAERENARDEYGALLAEVAELYRELPGFRRLLETPRIPAAQKREVIQRVFAGRVPEYFLRYLLIVIEKRRFRLLPEIDLAYRELVDERAGRVRASVTLAHEADDRLRAKLLQALSRRLDRHVIASWKTERELLGGVVVRVGDRVMDGSVRRRLRDMRRTLREPFAV